MLHNISDTQIMIIIRTFNIHGSTLAATPDISKAFNRVWHTGLLHKFTTYGISGKLFYPVSLFFSSENFVLFWMGRHLPDFYFLLFASSQGLN